MPNTRLVTATKVLLIPSWILGVAAALMAIDSVTLVIPELFTPIIGAIVLFGVFVAPLATLLAMVLAFWHTVRRQPPGTEPTRSTSPPRLWALIALSLVCSIAAWVLLAKKFTS